MATSVGTKADAFSIVYDILEKLDLNEVKNELSVYGSFDLSDPMEIKRRKAVQAIADRFKALVMRFNALNDNKALLGEFIDSTQFTANKVKVDLIENCFNKLLNYKMALTGFFERRPQKEGWSSILSELNSSSSEIRARVMWQNNTVFWKF